jgi:hypothetical protein
MTEAPIDEEAMREECVLTSHGVRRPACRPGEVVSTNRSRAGAAVPLA